MNRYIIPALEAPLCLHPFFPAASPAAGLEACVWALQLARPASVSSASVFARSRHTQCQLPPCPQPNPYRSVPTCHSLSQGEPVLPSCSCRLPYQCPFSRKRNFRKRKTSPFHDPWTCERVCLQTPAEPQILADGVMVENSSQV